LLPAYDYVILGDWAKIKLILVVFPTT